MRIAYFGGDMFYDCMELLTQSGHEIIALFTGTPGKNEYDPTQYVCRQAGALHIPIIRSKPTNEDIKELQRKGCDMILGAGYSYKIPWHESGIQYGINIHPSLLPEGAGPMPLPIVIIKGLKKTGLTLHKISPDWDAGAIVLQESFPLFGYENIEHLLHESQAIVTSRAAGRVSEIHIKVGEKVNKGQSLLTIQPIFVGSSPVSIPSPITGYVTKQSVVLGQSVTPEAALMEVGESSEVLVRGVMYETPDVTKIQVGQNVRVTSSLLGSDALLGKVQRMDGAYDRGSRTFNVYALVSNPDRKLLANMQVVLSIEITTPSDILTVPVKAILGDSGEQFVFVRSGNDFERRSVKLGAIFSNDREVLEGVFPDEEVVTVGNYQLQFAKSSEPKKNGEKPDDGHGHEH